MVANLRNADEDLAGRVADRGSAWQSSRRHLAAAAEPNRSLKPSAKLSILANGPASFAGRKVGVLVTDGAPAKAVKALAAAVKAEKATLEVDRARRSPASTSTTARVCPRSRWSGAALRSCTTQSR